jgi:hypothetical protein
MMRHKSKDWRLPIGAILLTAAVAGPGRGQERPPLVPDFAGDPILPRQVTFDFAGPAAEAQSAGRTPHFPLFRMPTGYLADPPGLDLEEDPAADGADLANAPLDPNNRLGLALGPDNPFFDFRGPGNPGGVGFYRMHTQYQFLDSATTNVCLALQAATPAGLDSDGVAGGPTSMCPALTCFHELQGGTAVQGFVSKYLPARPGWSDQLERSLRYGLAFQSPVPGVPASPGQSVHLFVEALGYSRWSNDPGPRPQGNWELLPGVHVRGGDNWWMSGGYLLPLGPSRQEGGLWQITCSVRF